MAEAGVRTEVGGRILTLTNLGKPLFPSGTTKAELVQYYLRIAPVMLPHLAGRCLTRLRFPGGSNGPSFYEKNPPAGAPGWLTTQSVRSTDGAIDYVVATEPAALVYLANLASIELHAPQWTIDHATRDDGGAVILDGADEPRATTVVIDLDPGPGITMIELSTAALLIANRLAADGLIPEVKTSGSKGLQLSAGCAPTPSETVVAYVKRIGTELTAEHPDKFVVTMAKAARADRIYIDYLQNKAARNTICPYSVRGRDDAYVATPLTWDEVAAVTEPDALRFTLDDVVARVEHHGDLFADLVDPLGPELPTG